MHFFYGSNRGNGTAGPQSAAAAPQSAAAGLDRAMRTLHKGVNDRAFRVFLL
ncbi:hypothetical protein K788_0006430 [Paraburkholderia caribensis MBA4]|uniref:Uncharacterized protein n=1 Tax=Paraburkholderia caribensis MBA4 TaxID=1323664 RepID=A0A0P0RBK2_9BURK|nr:hypothetical protein K788_0006430 [Paraburkholderia caribensis MBA4]